MEGEIKKTDNYSKIAKTFGEWKYLIPVSILAGSTYYTNPDSEIGKWGINSVRAYAVGVPALLAMQTITGASRPKESGSSNWKPFNDNNGVSGHAFIGAIPFLTIAKMNTNKPIKYMSYVASGLTAWSRVNDDAHFISQAVLGWYMAYESVGSVFDTNNNDKFSITPLIGNDTYGFNISKSW